jgi:uncharacterized small protein (TIGR04563 family)
MASAEKQKQSLYFPDDMLREIMREATRLDRSLSWTVQQAWRLARAELLKLPAARFPAGAEHDRPPASADRAGDAEERQPSAQVREFIRGKFDRELDGPRDLDGLASRLH